MGNLDKILECINNNDVSSLTSDDWCKLLATNPQYCTLCNTFDNFTIKNWVDLISAQVQFATIFDKWNNLTDTQMKDLLILYPALYKKMDVRKIKSIELIDLILAQPHLAKIKDINDNMDEDVWHNAIQEGQTEAAIYRFDWENAHSDKIWEVMNTPPIAKRCNTNFWVRALLEDNNFIDECQCLENFSIEQWCNLLSHNSGFGDKCPILDKISIEQWVDIIIENSYSAQYFNSWDKLTIEQWNNLFSFSFGEVYSHCNIWDKITSTKFWAKRISLNPNCASECPYWEDFTSDDWIVILREQPQFADRCSKWNEFSSDNWCFLLKYQIQFANREELTIEIISSFTEDDWNLLLEVIDDFEKIRATQGEELNWSYLITTCPDYRKKFNRWDSFNGQDWSIVLRKYPELAIKCDKWDEFSSSNWSELLRIQNQFFEKCNKWNEFTSSDWERYMEMQSEEHAKDFIQYWDKFNPNTQYWILLYSPELKEYCNCWNQFSENQWNELIKEYPQMQEEKAKLSSTENLLFNTNVDSIQNPNIIEDTNVIIDIEENNIPIFLQKSILESIDNFDDDNIPFDLPIEEITHDILSLSFSTLTKISKELQDKYDIKNFKSLHQFNLDNAESIEDRNHIADLKIQWQPGNWILSDLTCKLLFNNHYYNFAKILHTAKIETIGDFLNFEDFTSVFSERDAKILNEFKGKLVNCNIANFSEEQRNFIKKLCLAALKFDNDNIPFYFPDKEIYGRYFNLSFSNLTKISEELQDKYKITCFKSLHQFNLDNTDSIEDRNCIEDLKIQWQPGNWILSNLPCDKLFSQNSKINTGNILTRLNNANIITIGDFFNCSDFNITTLSKDDKERCKHFRDNCLDYGVDKFIEVQRIYMKKLHSKILTTDDANFYYPNIIISYDYLSFSFSTLTKISKELQDQYNIKSFESLSKFNLDNADSKDKEYIKDLKNQWQHGSWVLSELPCNKLFSQNSKIITKLNNAKIKTIGDFLNFEDFNKTTLSENDKKTCKYFRNNCLDYGIDNFSKKQRNYRNILLPKKLTSDIESKIQKLKSASTPKDALKVILGDSFNNDYLDYFIDYIISEKKLDTIAKKVGKTTERIRQVIQIEVPDTLKNVTWWNDYCFNLFSKFGKICTQRAIAAKGNELLGNDLGKVITHYLSTADKNIVDKISEITKILVNKNIHTLERVENLRDRITNQLISNGCSKISKDDFLDKCSVITEYFSELNLDNEYISNDSLWDIFKPKGKNENPGNTVKLQSPKEFIRQHNIVVEPTLRSDIINMMRQKGYTGSIPENNFAPRLDLAVHSQNGLEFNYILKEDLPQLSKELLNDIAAFINEELKTTSCINLEQVCVKYQLSQVTPFMLKAILKQENALKNVIYSNTSTQIWQADSEISGLQELLEKRLKNAKAELYYGALIDIKVQKAYPPGAIANTINSSEKILTGGSFQNLYYLHIDKLNFDTEKLSPICSTIEEKLLLSVEDIFNSHNQLCLDLGIKDARLLSSILKKYTQYYVDYPTVAFNRESSQTLIEMGLNFIKEEKWRKYEEIINFYAEKSFNSQWLLLKNHPDILLISENCVAHKDNIGWKDEYIDIVLNLAKEALEKSGKKYLDINEFSYHHTDGKEKGKLPQLKNTSWSPTLIKNILKNNDKFVVTGCNDSIFFIKEESLNTFEDICLWIKNEEKPTDIIKYLVKEGIISNNWQYDQNNKEFLETLRIKND